MKLLRTALFLLGILVISSLQALASDETPRTITVSGEGRASAPPDMATIQTGVVTQGATAIEALSANNEIMSRIMDVLDKRKIAEKDIQTSSLNVSPQYEQNERGWRENRIIGYSVSNQVQVKVLNLKDLGEVIDTLVQAGSNQVSGISFGIDDSSKLINQARERAVADARDRAGLYARAAGVRLGRVIAISEQSAGWPMIQGAYRMLDAEAASSVPVAAGEQEYSVTIQMVFSLDERE